MTRDLVERAMAGDHDAYAELVRDRIGRLHHLARLILRDDVAAEDATQEALVAAWRDLSALRDPERFEAWLHRLLVRACYREARRSRRQVAIEATVRPLTSNEPDPGLHVADRDAIERGFSRLDTDGRAILVLRFYVGLSTDETADVLGIPAGTVKSRMHRAIGKLRATLDSDVPPTIMTQGRTA
jgi:RNA polymerase sigma-70 factor (ECF subfamily)